MRILGYLSTFHFPGHLKSFSSMKDEKLDLLPHFQSVLLPVHNSVAYLEAELVLNELRRSKSPSFVVETLIE